MVFFGTPAGRNSMARSELGAVLHELSMKVSPWSISSQPRRDKEFLGKRAHDISFKFEQKWLSATTDVLSVSDKVSTVAPLTKEQGHCEPLSSLRSLCSTLPRPPVQAFLTLLFALHSPIFASPATFPAPFLSRPLASCCSNLVFDPVRRLVGRDLNTTRCRPHTS